MAATLELCRPINCHPPVQGLLSKGSLDATGSDNSVLLPHHAPCLADS